jgi:hypothetical protein
MKTKRQSKSHAGFYICMRFTYKILMTKVFRILFGFRGAKACVTSLVLRVTWAVEHGRNPLHLLVCKPVWNLHIKY